MCETLFWKVGKWEKIEKVPLDLHKKLKYLGGGKDTHTSPSNGNSSALGKKRNKEATDNWSSHRAEEQGCRFWTRAPHAVFLDRTRAAGLGTLMGQ